VFPSLALVLVFTTAFVITGLYSLIRFSALVSSAAPGGDRMAELSHLLMSIAMIGMAWGWTGGPDTPGGVVQLAVFGLLSAWFLARVLRPDGHRRIGSVYHLLAMVAMVWMVAAMPGLMGMSAGSASASGAHEHDGHGAMGGMVGASGMAAPSPAPPWMQVVTVTFVVLLGAAAVTCAARAVRAAQVPVLAAPSGQAAPQVEGEPRLRGPRLDASCHVLMSLGMAGMLLAML
jgi:Domain of unknown function (DUF5134)